jgi:predicted nucleic acid-binding protein
VLIEESHLLPALYGRVLIPPAVTAELDSSGTPDTVRQWIRQRLPWLEVRALDRMPEDLPKFFDLGEREAIALSQELNADLLLIDEWDGREEARRRQLNIAGTLRVLASAADRGLVDLTAAISRLRSTNFRASEKLIQSFLDRDGERKRR